jgi:hypothetical protein
MKEVLYYLYERRLLRQMRRGPIPTHIDIILEATENTGSETASPICMRFAASERAKLDGVLDSRGQLAIPAVTLSRRRARSCAKRTLTRTAPSRSPCDSASWCGRLV